MPKPFSHCVASGTIAFVAALAVNGAWAEPPSGTTLDLTMPGLAIPGVTMPDFSSLDFTTPDITTSNRATPPVTPPKTEALQTATIGKRTEKPDGSTALTVGERLPTDWETKVGVDFGLAAPLSTTPQPENYLQGLAQQDRSTGVGWANLSLPGLPLGWDKGSIDARVDSAKGQGKIGTVLSRSVPIGDGVSLTLQNGYAVTQSLAGPESAGVPVAPASPNIFSSDTAVRLNLPTATTFSAGAKMSSTDEKWLGVLSAEQKLFNGPLNVTGSISERPTGEPDKSIKAGLKKTW